jgi:hypothetical protein
MQPVVEKYTKCGLKRPKELWSLSHKNQLTAKPFLYVEMYYPRALLM